MSRILKIMSIAVILFLAYIWFGVLVKSCNETNEESISESERYSDDEVDSIPLDDVFFNESISEDEINYEDIDKAVDVQTSTETETLPEPEEAKPSEAKKTSTEPKEIPVTKPAPPAQKTLPPIQTSTASSNDDKAFMVMAGSYLIEVNADEMVAKLKNMGFQSAEKVVFDDSKFHSVCVGRFKENDDAIKLTSDLKIRGIDSYVHRKKN